MGSTQNKTRWKPIKADLCSWITSYRISAKNQTLECSLWCFDGCNHDYGIGLMRVKLVLGEALSLGLQGLTWYLGLTIGLELNFVGASIVLKQI